MPKLTNKQALFCKEYIVDLNATQAAIRAGYSIKTAQRIGSENLSKPLIEAEIQRLMDDRSSRTLVTADRVINEIAKLAFINTQDILNEDGNLKPINEWSRDDAAAIQEITEDSIGKDGDNPITRRKVKLSDKKASLELLGRHLKLFTDKIESDTTLTVIRKEFKPAKSK